MAKKDYSIIIEAGGGSAPDYYTKADTWDSSVNYGGSLTYRVQKNRYFQELFKAIKANGGDLSRVPRSFGNVYSSFSSWSVTHMSPWFGLFGQPPCTV